MVAVATQSATLDHQLPGGGSEDEAAGGQEGGAPHGLEQQAVDEGGARALLHEDVDGRHQEGGEGQETGDLAHAIGQKAEGEDEAREEVAGDAEHELYTAVVEQPEGGQVRQD